MSHHAWPSWRYGPKGEAAVFASEADVPSGWHDHPSKHGKAAPAAAPAATKTRAPAKSAATSAAKPAAKGKKAGRKPKAAPLDL